MSSGLRAVARETVAIAEAGVYRAGGREVVIGPDVARAVAGTRLHLPGEVLAAPAARDAAGPGAVEVTGETTLGAARRLGGDVAALVFASARNPGGGFLNGATAQEEDVARCSALHPCLLAAGDFYAYHRARPELTYSDRVIHSPGVPVFRGEDLQLLAEPFAVSFLTAAAPNRSAIAGNQPQLLAGVPGILARRAARILDVAAAHGHRRLVLGAWGCGVFGNDPDTVAGAFAGALATRPWFDLVLFAVLDRRPGTPVLGAFERALGVRPGSPPAR